MYIVINNQISKNFEINFKLMDKYFRIFIFFLAVNYCILYLRLI
jgi:hypothetical protein